MRKLCIALLITLLLSGCGAKKSTAPTTPEDLSEPIRQAEEVEKIINDETLVDLIRLELAYQATSGRAQYIAKLEEMAEITITDYTQDVDTITATVTVVAPDMYAIAKAMENEPFTDADSVDEEICAQLDDCEDFVNETFEVTFQCVEEEWVVVFTEELTDAIYGGLITYRNEYLANMEEQ